MNYSLFPGSLVPHPAAAPVVYAGMSGNFQAAAEVAKMVRSRGSDSGVGSKIW